MRQYEFVAAPQGSEPWLELRKTGITATDMTAIMGVSPWKTAFALYAEKTGQFQPEPVGEAAHRGLILEDAVATWWESQHEGKKLRRSNGVLRLKDVPWAMCSIDRMVQGEDHIVEIKTSASPLWRIGIPEFVQVQCQWQLLISGFEEMTVAALLGGLVFREETVKADRNLQTEMFRKAELFLKAVETRTAPALDGRDSDVLAAVKPHSSEEWATADTGIDRVAAMYSQALYESRLLDEQISNLAISIKEAIGERQGIVGNTGWVATWRANKSSQRTDWKAVAEVLKDVAPETYEASVLSYTKEREGSRVFKYKEDQLDGV